MQWSELTEEKQKYQLAQTEFRFIAKGGGNHYMPRLLTALGSAITWQSTEAESPFSADCTMSGPRATRVAAAACTQE